MSMKTFSERYERKYERAALRSAFVSLFWVIISERKKRFGLTLQALAKMVGVNKAALSRWFKGDPNWTINTIGALAHALNVEIRIIAVDRKSGEVYTPSGIQVPHALSATIPVQVNGITATDPLPQNDVFKGSSRRSEAYD